jgi:peptide/nickel transport system permease protein
MTAETPSPAVAMTYAQRRARALRGVEVLVRNRSALIGTVLTSAFLVVGVCGLVMVATPSLHHLYLDQDLEHALQPPLHGYGVLGTDPLGRSMAARLVAGIGISLGVAAIVTVFSLVVGGAVGIVAGFYRGRIDTVLSGVIDITWGFPIVLIAVVLTGVLSPGLSTVVLAISLINWAGFARIIRGEVLGLREQGFIRAAGAIGFPDWKIVLRHIVPNLLGPTLVMGSYYVGITIVAEAGLSFIGVGAQPPTPSLGQIIADGQNYWSTDSWVLVIPATALALIVLGLNALGDGLRDLVDPRLRVRG